MMLAIDPGIRGCGVASFNEHTKELLAAAYVRNTDTAGADLEAQNDMARAVLAWAKFNGIKMDHFPTLVAEWPQIYPQGRKPGDPNKSLLPLCGVVAHVSGAHKWGDRRMVKPREWKGTLNGDVMTQRILTHLTDEERTRIQACPASLIHNAIDAAGLGLKHLGRLDKIRHYAR